MGDTLNKILEPLLRNHEIAVEALTRDQLVDAIRQAIKCGDFARLVESRGQTQCVVYRPFAEANRLSGLYHELLFAVVRKHDDETRHETALRYIREAESRVYDESCEKQNTT